MKKALTIVILVLALAAMAFAGVTAPRTGAQRAVCHGTSSLSITVAKSVKAGRSTTVKGAVNRGLGDHGLTATLQYRKSTSSVWRTGVGMLMSTRYYSLKWKAPAKRGKYKLRIAVENVGGATTETMYTATRTVVVY